MGAPGKMLVDAAIIVSQVGKQSDLTAQDIPYSALNRRIHMCISHLYIRESIQHISWFTKVRTNLPSLSVNVLSTD